MTELIYEIINFITSVHSKILNWNDTGQTAMTDKQLHFWVMGILGIVLLLIVYPIFLYLAKRSVLIIAGIYVFTLMFVIAFAIEIEQGITGTGVMDFKDAISGLSGFMWMFLIFAVIRFVFYLFNKIVKAAKKPKKNDRQFSDNDPYNI